MTVFFFSFILFLLLMVFYRPISAQAYIILTILSFYCSEVIPDIKAYRWHGKFKKMQKKLKVVSKSLGESRKLDYEEEENKKREERKSFGYCQGFGCDKNGVEDGERDPLEMCPKKVN